MSWTTAQALDDGSEPCHKRQRGSEKKVAGIEGTACTGPPPLENSFVQNLAQEIERIKVFESIVLEKIRDSTEQSAEQGQEGLSDSKSSPLGEDG